ncbi:hypothetical protein Tco_1233025, partial [Tanacetum coccineum]
MFFNDRMILGGDICDGRIVHRFHELRVMDQLLPADASPIALSPDYISDSDPEEDPEEDPADYPADGGDNDDNESSDDDNDDDD